VVREADSDLAPHGKSQTATLDVSIHPATGRLQEKDAGTTAGPGVTGDDARAYSVTRKTARDGGSTVLARGFGLM